MKNLTPNLWGHLQAPVMCFAIFSLVAFVGVFAALLIVNDENLRVAENERRYRTVVGEEPPLEYRKWPAFRLALILPVVIGLICAAGGWMSYQAAAYDCRHDYRNSECWTVTDKHDVNLHGDLNIGGGK